MHVSTLLEENNTSAWYFVCSEWPDQIAVCKSPHVMHHKYITTQTLINSSPLSQTYFFKIMPYGCHGVVFY